MGRGTTIVDRLNKLSGKDATTIAKALENLEEGGGIGGFEIHICTSAEYDSSTLVPTVTNPDASTLYLVPTSSKSKNMFDEYVWTGTDWEKFGTGSVALPSPTTADNGKVLGVDGGEYKLVEQSSGLQNLLDGEARGSMRSVASATESDSYKLGSNAVSFGSFTQASGNTSFAIGFQAVATNKYAFAEGNGTTASGECSHAEGKSTTASGNYSHAEGKSTTASGIYSHAEGGDTTALINYAHAEGYRSSASGNYSHAEGISTEAKGQNSHAQNRGTIATGKSQTTIGEYNVEQGTSGSREETDYAFIIGNGTDSGSRSNAFAIRWDGAIVLADGTVLTVAQLKKIAALA